MKNNNIEMHRSEINQIKNGWQFFCHTCGFHAQYTANNGSWKLEVLNAGNQDVRHSTNEMLNMDRIVHLESQIEDVLNSYVRKYGEW